MNHKYWERAQFFLQQNRVTEAEAELRNVLAQDPNDAHALSLLAECRFSQRDYTAGFQLAQQAHQIAPNNSFILYTFARANFFNQDIEAARQLLQRGLTLSPNDHSFWHLLGEIEYYEKNWNAALDAIESGLIIAPENVELINLRALALIKLNKKADADATMDYALNRAPEDSYSHSNKGWVLVERDQYDEAIGHFQEALRLNPNSETAKNGLKEAIKGKNVLYRGILKYFLWMKKLQSKSQWGVIIGAYILYRIVLSMNEQIPELSFLLVPLIVAYITFAFASWLGMPISNLFLQLHPLGKLALSKDEKTASLLVGATVVTSLLFLLLYTQTVPAEQKDFYFWLFIFTGIMTIPIAGVFLAPPDSKVRTQLIIYSAALLLVGLAFTFSSQSIWLTIFIVGIFAFQFVAPYLINRAARMF